MAKKTVNAVKSEKVTVEKFTDQQFLDEELKRKFTYFNKEYADNMDKLAKYIHNELKSKSTFEIGCGTGTLLRLLLDKAINAWGFDPSKPHKQWWDANLSPADRFHHGESIRIGEHFDTIIAIEVFEHLTDEQIKQYLLDCSGNCDYFVFSSTSIKDTPEFDIQWGHINVKEQKDWISLFKEYGFEVYKKIKFPTDWTIVFKSKI